GVITSLVVGNEVLLRGEMTTTDLAAIIRSVKAEVTVPVTYADVWEFWLRYREIYDAVDFITIHILPYLEDFPIRAKYAAAHVNSIRQRMAVTFPGKEIRIREAALPSRTNQARVVSEILSLAKLENFRVNLIEAYDQPWKRQLEGTVGGYWGLYDSVYRALKFPPVEMADGRRHGVLRHRVRLGLAHDTATALDTTAFVVDRGRPVRDFGGQPARDRRRQDALRELWRRRLVAVGRVARGRPAVIGARRQRAGLRAFAADVSGDVRPARRQPAARAVDVVSRRRAGRDRAGRWRNRARLRVRPALPRFSLCEPHHGGGAVRLPAAEPAANGPASDGGGGVCGTVGGLGRLHRRE